MSPGTGELIDQLVTSSSEITLGSCKHAWWEIHLRIKRPTLEWERERIQQHTTQITMTDLQSKTIRTGNTNPNPQILSPYTTSHLISHLFSPPCMLFGRPLGTSFGHTNDNPYEGNSALSAARSTSASSQVLSSADILHLPGNRFKIAMWRSNAGTQWTIVMFSLHSGDPTVDVRCIQAKCIQDTSPIIQLKPFSNHSVRFRPNYFEDLEM